MALRKVLEGQNLADFRDQYHEEDEDKLKRALALCKYSTKAEPDNKSPLNSHPILSADSPRA